MPVAIGGLSDRVAYLVNGVGFVEGTLDEVVATFKKWQPKYRATAVTGTLDELLNHLNPLVDRIVPRRMFIATDSGWSAYVDCLIRANDSKGVCHVLAQSMARRAVATDFNCTGSEYNDLPSYLPGMQIQIFHGRGGSAGSPYLRVVAAILDGGRWVFDQSGEVQDFEEVESYSKRRIRDRFTVEMLDRYCRALGIRLFDYGFYGPEAILLEADITHPDAIEYPI